MRKIRSGIHLPFKANELRLQVIFQNIKNPLYWDEQMLPNQAAGNFSQVLSALSWNLRLYKFHFNNQLIWQIPDEKTNTIFRTPEWSGLHSVYYQNSMFNNVLKLQIGADLQWFSEYYANAYNPVTRTFYIQNRRKQGNYPLTDLFVAAEIHTFRAFLKLEHANFEFREDKFPNLYYSSPGYSLPPRRLVMGVIWKFYI